MVTPGDERVVVISGANEGIGYHMLTALLEDRYRVAGLDVNGENINSLRDTAPDLVQFYEFDVANTDDVHRAITGVIDRWDRIDILVNNSAIATFAPLDEPSPADMRREFDVNSFDYLRTIRAVLPHVRARNGGINHNMSSGTGRVGHPGLAGYASTKGAIEAFTRSLRLELQHETVPRSSMQPPITNTRMSAELGYPEWMLNGSAAVGRKLAGKVESTTPVIAADWQTKVGLALLKPSERDRFRQPC